MKLIEKAGGDKDGDAELPGAESCALNEDEEEEEEDNDRVVFTKGEDD
jgi:hypothetical protein